MSRRERRVFTDKFWKQMIQLHLNGKSRKDILAEYDLVGSTCDSQFKQSQGSGSFRAKDNRTHEEVEFIILCKELQHLKMENGIFKQAALIMR